MLLDCRRDVVRNPDGDFHRLPFHEVYRQPPGRFGHGRRGLRFPRLEDVPLIPARHRLRQRRLAEHLVLLFVKGPRKIPQVQSCKTLPLDGLGQGAVHLDVWVECALVVDRPRRSDIGSSARLVRGIGHPLTVRQNCVHQEFGYLADNHVHAAVREPRLHVQPDTQVVLSPVEDTRHDGNLPALPRNEIFPEYKANRPDPPDELIPQFPLVRDATRAFNVECLERPGFEADDLIATYTRRAQADGFEVMIVSSDKDLMQLVSDRVSMFDALKNRKIGPAEVEEKFGVGPERVVDVQALAGDSTDNVPGVPGIGVKTAAQLIQAYGDLDSLLARAPEIKQPKRRQSLIDFAEQARLSRELVRLRDDVPTDVTVPELQRRDPDPAQLLAFLEEQGFRSVMAKVQHRLASGQATPMTEDAPAGTRYELVQSVEVLQDWVTRARYAGAVAIDTETTSLDESRADLVGISLCVQPGHACYIPLAHRLPEPVSVAEGSPASEESPARQREPLEQIPLDAALDVLRPLFADPSVLKIGHNLKYDMVVLRRYDVAIAPLDDTMLMSYVLDGGSHGHGMDELAVLHLNHRTIPFKDVTGTGKSQVTFDLVPLDRALAYAAEDADVTLRLHRFLKPRLLADRMVTPYETLERPLVPVLADMETDGIRVDRAKLEALSREFAERQQALEQDVYRLAGHEFNVGSPKQLGEVLFDELRLEGGHKGKSGAYATGADVLESLAAEGHELPATVLEWRQLDKLKSTYTDALVEQINPRTGRVHTSFAMAAASTGRLSSVNPNLQNIPIRTEDGRKIRHAFVAEPGRILLSLDYSQIELRLLAHIAGIDALKRAFHDGQDIHALTAAQMFGGDAGTIDPAMRRQAKAINFGIIYGISAFGLSRQLGIPTRKPRRT